MKKIILAIIAVIVFFILFSLFTSENVNSIEGGFTELAFERNENNTGPIQRVYAYSVADTLWGQMQLHVDLLPHSKYGTTQVYYFLASNIPEVGVKLSLEGLSEDAKRYCIAQAKKDGQARIKLAKFPFQ